MKIVNHRTNRNRDGKSGEIFQNQLNKQYEGHRNRIEEVAYHTTSMAWMEDLTKRFGAIVRRIDTAKALWMQVKTSLGMITFKKSLFMTFVNKDAHPLSVSSRSKKLLKDLVTSFARECLPQRIKGGSMSKNIEHAYSSVWHLCRSYDQHKEPVRVSIEHENEAINVFTKVCRLDLCWFHSTSLVQRSRRTKKELYPWRQKRNMLVVPSWSRPIYRLWWDTCVD